MGVSFSGLHRTKAEREKDEEVRKIVEERDKDYVPEYLQARVIDEQEDLHFRELRRRFIRVWAILGNATIIGGLVAPQIATDVRASAKYTLVLSALLAVSLIASVLLLYRQHKLIRRTATRIKKLKIADRRNRQRMSQPNDEEDRVLVEQKRYREELPDIVAGYRNEGNRYRRWHNGFQSIIIVGSVGTSAITTASVSYPSVRWAAVGVSAVIGLAAGFTGYFKYRERSFNLQQTSDAIDREYESVELRVGKYSGMDEAQAYATFCAYVENLRDEQSKRQQQLDQPVDVSREQSSAQ